ncbi:MAG: hypothetical protein ABH842_03815 [Candidatus Micrarchaeota archaeon]
MRLPSFIIYALFALIFVLMLFMAFNIFDHTLLLILITIDILLFFCLLYLFITQRLSKEIDFTKYPIEVPVLGMHERAKILPDFILQEDVSGVAPKMVFFQDHFEFNPSAIGIRPRNKRYSEVELVDVTHFLFMDTVKFTFKGNLALSIQLLHKKNLILLLKFLNKKGCIFSPKTKKLLKQNPS